MDTVGTYVHCDKETIGKLTALTANLLTNRNTKNYSLAITGQANGH